MPVNRGFTGKLVQTVTGAAAGAAGAQYVVGTTGVSTGTGTLFIGVNVDTAVPIKVDSAGVVSVSGGGGGVQYTIGTTTIAATGTGTIMLGVNSTTVRGIQVDANGVVSVSGGGGGVQYTLATTTIAATGTGTLIFGINSTTLRALRMTADGTIFVANTGTQVVSGTVTSIPSNTGTLSNVLSVGTVLGILAISGTVDGTFGAGTQYTQDTTTIGATGTGTLFIGVNATTARALTLSVTGDPGVRQVGVWNVATVSTVLGTVAISGSITSIPSNTGTLSNVLTVGTVLGTLLVSGSVTPLGQPFAMYQTHIATQWNSGLVTITTSAAGVGGILKTSGANTVYVTDIIVSVDVPMNITLRSATTGLAMLYLATKGGMTFTMRTPMVCTTAQSFTFIPSVSGSASVWAAGYTVT